MSGPLHGVRVLEFTQIIAGPLGGQHLADMGADVIKVEPPQGEPWRATSQFLPGESKPFHVLNRGKRSLTLDLRNPHAQEVIHRLIGTIDVVVINYRPDVAARMGLDYETLSGLKPDLVYVDSTSFGRRGPWAMKGGYDIVAQAVAGVLSSAARFDAHGTPVLMMGGLPVLDLATGYAIGMAALAGLYHRAVSGEGQFFETSLLQSGLILQHGKFSSLPPADVTTRTRFLAELEEARATGLGYRDIVERKREEYEAGQVANVYYRVYYTADGAIAVGSAGRGAAMMLAFGLGTLPNLLLAGLLWGFDRWQAKRGKRPEGRVPVSFKWLFLLAFIGCLTHPALDWLNVYGVRLLEPFSSQWFYGDTLFIIDVWLWALMGFATWFSLRREKRGGEWMRPARTAIVVALGYIGLN